MNLRAVSLSIYAFGYSAGFIRDERRTGEPPVRLDNLADLACRYELGGVEFPVDRYFAAADLENAGRFIAAIQARGLNVAVDLETFSPAYVRALLPVLAACGLTWARIKMADFYGGNRFKQPDFTGRLAAFVDDLRGLLPDLRASGARLLIENHQDLGSEDLVRIIAATSSDCIGINWDVGNSLAVCDTPASFLDAAGGFIGNVHLKDYRIGRSDAGISLCRCALGDGVVDFASVLQALTARHGAVPMAIELGAQVSREALIYDRAYWEAYPPRTVGATVGFFDFVSRHLDPAPRLASGWERGLTPDELVALEHAELQRSVAHLSGLNL